ncbi:MAG: NAD(+) synthase [Clostridia bacterium]|nr:NAD(+) synthase [Clostridia bacterium]
MKDGFIKVAAGIPQIKTADIENNVAAAKELICRAEAAGVQLLVLPELCITGYTCGDLFFNDALVKGAKQALFELAEFTEEKQVAAVVGLPMVYGNKLYNCAAVLQGGEIKGIVPKTFIPDHSEFNEKRYFETGRSVPPGAFFSDETVCCVEFGNDLLFTHQDYRFAVEICEDLFAPIPLNQRLALGGAQIIVNLAACTQIIGKADYCKSLITNASERLHCGYILASGGGNESVTDTVFAGHAVIAENGQILAENPPFGKHDIIISEIDVGLLSAERRKNTSFVPVTELREIPISQTEAVTELTRTVAKNPFIPNNKSIDSLAEEILQIQSHALAKRLEHTRSKTAVIGISGGLDSTLALLVAVRAMRLLSRPLTDILAVTMPCFGTTSRTRSNSELLCQELGVSFREINIAAAVKQHFEDIGQSQADFDVTYENSQARERTQVLMDLANKENGIVIGTGDLSELALGWATYNGDHMSMYSVNSGVPKTLIRHIVAYEAANAPERLGKVLCDILDTPVSPELLPADSKGEIAQKTEDLVGPYELHDFFLYHILRYNAAPQKIFRMAVIAFPEYSKQTVLKWLTVFIRRFFTQQFKRSCLPDGPKVCEISLSPRSGLLMPSDASAALWLKELEKIEI